MAANEEFVNYVIDQLSEYGEVQTRKMFGGTNLFREGLMFAKIKGSTLRLKVNDPRSLSWQHPHGASY